ncbi:Hypothetical_protein [Hexamita inflata]|uniref:Hypothetical_protein n=1 Tax=Hexamita inflata TaxID=28002 RepID=A0AA86QLQ9_9EUKA|nr:Hypothetical protein HINF_LOCUS49519 [Hexamita inflata]
MTYQLWQPLEEKKMQQEQLWQNTNVQNLRQTPTKHQATTKRNSGIVTYLGQEFGQDAKPLTDQILANVQERIDSQVVWRAQVRKLQPKIHMRSQEACHIDAIIAV